jgi:predicted P-loop ATPase
MLKENIGIGHDMLKRFLDSAYVEKYDPFVAYFEGLQVWDGTTDYIGKLASSVHLVDPTEAQPFAYNLMRWFIGYVGTAVDPVAVNQAAIVFSGAQGIQKTRWFDRLVPAQLAGYQFTGTIDPESKDAKISLSECILINLDEMESMRKSDIGSLKSIMTLSKIRERRPYGSFSENMIRHASFVGSINATDFLDDPSGSRRFLTFEAKSFDFAAIPDIDMVMAQAYSLYKAGERWWFEDHEIKQINERNMKHSVVSYEEELLSLHVAKGDGKCWLTATGIAQVIKANDKDFRVDDRSVQKIGVALKKLGYERTRSNGSKTYNVTTLNPVTVKAV